MGQWLTVPMIAGGIYLIATSAKRRQRVEPIAGSESVALSPPRLPLRRAAMTDRPTLADRLARAITLAGPISIAQFMAAANAHYYATRDPLGARGDFTTAPEISQMFGELIGLWCADLWDRAGTARHRLGRARAQAAARSPAMRCARWPGPG